MKNTTWLIEPLDSETNQKIASLGEGVEECPDMLCFDHQGKPRRANLWRVEEVKADFACNSRQSRRLHFILYKQVGDDEPRQVLMHKPLGGAMGAVENPFKYKIPRRKQGKLVIKGSSLLRRHKRQAQRAMVH